MSKRTTKTKAEPGPRVGRPRMSTNGPRRTLVVSVPPETDDELRDLADSEQRPLSWVVRELLRLGLTTYQRKVP